MKYRKKPVVVDAITFKELVNHGINQGADLIDGMPRSFQYNGHVITHEDNGCYILETLEGTERMTKDDMLITGIKGEIYPCKIDIFEKLYDIV